MTSVRRRLRRDGVAGVISRRSGLEVVAFPSIGTGPAGVEPSDAARAMVDEIRAHKGPTPHTIWLVDADDAVLRAFIEALQNASLNV